VGEDYVGDLSEAVGPCPLAGILASHSCHHAGIWLLLDSPNLTAEGDHNSESKRKTLCDFW
jgi:hypothetical protein